MWQAVLLFFRGGKSHVEAAVAQRTTETFFGKEHEAEMVFLRIIQPELLLDNVSSEDNGKSVAPTASWTSLEKALALCE